MESAIHSDLTCPRSLTRRVPDDYVPAYPSYCARPTTPTEQVVMCYLGVQYGGEAERGRALAAVRHMVSMLDAPDGPKHHDLTYHLDHLGLHNLMIAAYWLDPAAHERWRTSVAVAGWWDSDDRLDDGVGYFRETQRPRAEQIETVYGYQDSLPGVGAALGGVSGEINEHGYWGSMRERFPLSQTDWMQPSGKLTVISGEPAKRGRVIVAGHDNVVLIRSGQEWTDAGAEGRSAYLDKIEPTLVEGMNFLRDNGPAVGCYSSRFVQNIDLDGNLLDETYNVGHWASLTALERWAESHPTHLRIFATFLTNAASLLELRLYHEVSVSDGQDQTFEYVNCHPETGMMRDTR